MVGIRSFPFGEKAYFAVSFRECICLFLLRTLLRTTIFQEHPLRHLGRCLTQNTEFLQVVQVDLSAKFRALRLLSLVGLLFNGIPGPKTDTPTQTHVYIYMKVFWYTYFHILLYLCSIWMHLKHGDLVGRQKRRCTFCFGISRQQFSRCDACVCSFERVFLFSNYDQHHLKILFLDLNTNKRTCHQQWL